MKHQPFELRPKQETSWQPTTWDIAVDFFSIPYQILFYLAISPIIIFRLFYKAFDWFYEPLRLSQELQQRQRQDKLLYTPPQLFAPPAQKSFDLRVSKPAASFHKMNYWPLQALYPQNSPKVNHLVTTTPAPPINLQNLNLDQSVSPQAYHYQDSPPQSPASLPKPLLKPPTNTASRLAINHQTPPLELMPTPPLRLASSKTRKKAPLWQRFLKSLLSKQGLTYATTSLFLFVILGQFIYDQGTKSYRLVFAETTNAQEQLNIAQEALQKQDFLLAYQSFTKAEESLQLALSEVQKAAPMEFVPGIGDQIDAGASIIKAAHLVSLTGKNLSHSLIPIQDILQSPDPQTKLLDYSKEITTILLNARPQLLQASQDITQARRLLQKVDPKHLSSQDLETFIDAEKKIQLLEKVTQDFSQITAALPELLGVNRSKNYLLIFQNNAELRPTGGFIGSYGLLSFDQGRLIDFRPTNVYLIDGQIQVQDQCEKPPLVLQAISSCHGVRDANWDPDFPSSAQEIIRLYEKVGSEEIDGVFALTPPVIQKLMAITGPIELPQWETTVDQDNVISTIQYLTSIKYKNAADPKLFLIELAQILLDRIAHQSPEQWAQTMEILLGSLDQQELLLYSQDQDVQSFILAKDWEGGIIQADLDYLMINNANINGSKGSQFLHQDYHLQTYLLQDGSVENVLNISYKHTGNWTWPSSTITNYQRIYLPFGSQLLESTNPNPEGGKRGLTEVINQHQKTIFADYITIHPGGTINLTYRYRLPFNIRNNQETTSYKLTLQRQTGVYNTNVTHQITYDPYDYQPVHTNGYLTMVNQGTISGQFPLEENLTYQTTFRLNDLL